MILFSRKFEFIELLLVCLTYVSPSVMWLIKSVLYQVLESDDLPTAICWKCVSKLDVCFELMQEHIRGQNVFRRQRFSQRMPLNCTQREVCWVIFLCCYHLLRLIYIDHVLWFTCISAGHV
jgi:hypothetical protein